MKKLIVLMRIIVIFYFIIGLIKWDITTMVAGLLSLVLMIISSYFIKKLNYSRQLELLIYIFIITTEVLGEVYHFYTRVSYFDIIMHIYSSFVISYIGISIIKRYKLSRIVTILFIFSFAMMCESVWEIGEFSIDRIFKSDMQKDTVINNISSTYLSLDGDKPLSIDIYDVNVNGISFTDMYGGYIDIGLYDTISDMVCAVIGSILFIFIYYFKKKE